MSDVTRDEEEAQESSDEASAKPSDEASADGGVEGDEGPLDEEAKPAVTDQSKRAAGGDRPAAPFSEERINAPSMQTIGMLTVVAAATLVMWGAGRAACNYHEPGESLSPRATTLVARTRTPKDAALELSQRWLTADFETAEKLAGPELLPALQKDKASCSGAACQARKAAKTLSVATAIKGNPIDTIVSVRTTGLPGGDVTKLFQVEREGTEWKVTRELDPKAPLPELKGPPPGMTPTQMLQPGQLGQIPPGAPGFAPAPGSAPLGPTPGPVAPAPAAPAPAATAPVAPKPAAPAPAPHAP